MKMQLVNGEEIHVFITHIHPKTSAEDVKELKFKAEAYQLLSGNPKTKGGTVAKIIKGDTVIGLGKASLSLEDNFCKNTGFKVALTRALKNSDMSKEDRTTIWKKIFDGKYGYRKDV